MLLFLSGRDLRGSCQQRRWQPCKCGKCANESRRSKWGEKREERRDGNWFSFCANWSPLTHPGAGDGMYDVCKMLSFSEHPHLDWFLLGCRNSIMPLNTRVVRGLLPSPHLQNSIFQSENMPNWCFQNPAHIARTSYMELAHRSAAAIWDIERTDVWTDTEPLGQFAILRL